MADFVELFQDDRVEIRDGRLQETDATTGALTEGTEGRCANLRVDFVSAVQEDLHDVGGTGFLDERFDGGAEGLKETGEEIDGCDEEFLRVRGKVGLVGVAVGGSESLSAHGTNDLADLDAALEESRSERLDHVADGGADSGHAREERVDKGTVVGSVGPHLRKGFRQSREDGFVSESRSKSRTQNIDTFEEEVAILEAEALEASGDGINQGTGEGIQIVLASFRGDVLESDDGASLRVLGASVDHSGADRLERFLEVRAVVVQEQEFGVTTEGPERVGGDEEVCVGISDHRAETGNHLLEMGREEIEATSGDGTKRRNTRIDFLPVITLHSLTNHVSDDVDNLLAELLSEFVKSGSSSVTQIPFLHFSIIIFIIIIIIVIVIVIVIIVVVIIFVIFVNILTSTIDLELFRSDVFRTIVDFPIIAASNLLEFILAIDDVVEHCVNDLGHDLKGMFQEHGATENGAPEFDDFDFDALDGDVTKLVEHEVNHGLEEWSHLLLEGEEQIQAADTVLDGVLILAAHSNTEEVEESLEQVVVVLEGVVRVTAFIDTALLD